MRKHWTVLVRLLLALAGVAFICWSLTWRDHVLLPAGYAALGPQKHPHSVDALVIHRDSEQLTVRTPAGKTIIVSRSELGHHADQPRYRPGIAATLGGADLRLLLLGLVLTGLVFPLQGLRWLVLLRSRGLAVSYFKALRLTMVGLFFNFCMPGTTGGDVMKAYYAAKNSGQRGPAVMSVLFDRIGGLLGMLLLGALVGLTMLANPTVAMLTAIAWGALALLAIGGSLYFCKPLRNWLGIEKMLRRLPRGGWLERAHLTAGAFGDHPWAVAATVVISLPTQVALMLATAFAGKALGVGQSPVELLAVLPLIFVAGALPLTYQGLGIMEGLAIALLSVPGVSSDNQVVGMFLLFRLFMIVYALCGSVILLRGDVHLFPARVPQDVRQPV